MFLYQKLIEFLPSVSLRPESRLQNGHKILYILFPQHGDVLGESVYLSSPIQGLIFPFELPALLATMAELPTVTQAAF